MKILIIEDEILVAEYIESILNDHNHEVLGIACDTEEATGFILQQPDLCFVDIRLANGESGIDIGEMLSKQGVPFVYITANNELHTIKEAAKTLPEAYISKPFNPKDLIATIAIIQDKMLSNKTLPVKTSKGVVEIALTDILYIKSENIYCKIVTESKSYLERTTLKNLLEILNANFIRVHRSYVVNKSKISSQKSNLMYISGHQIPLSKGYFQK